MLLKRRMAATRDTPADPAPSPGAEDGARPPVPAGKPGAAEAELERLRRREAELEAEVARLRAVDGAIPRAIFESAVDFAIIATDREGQVVHWNKGAEAIFGWSAQEMHGRTIHRLFTPADRERGQVGDEMQRAREAGRTGGGGWRLRKDGSSFPAKAEMTPLHGEGGKHLGFLKIVRDRTAEREAGEAQRADAEFMRSVLASSGDCIKVLDLDANLLFMTDGGQRLMDVSDFNAIRGCPWPDFWKDGNHAAALAAVAAARAGGSGQFQGPADTMAGTPLWWDVQVTPILGADGRPEKLLSVSRDITATRRIEEALREAQGLNTLILKSSRDCIVVLDLDGNTQFVSPGGIASMEIANVDAILGLSWLRVWQGDDHVAARLAVAEARAGRTGRFQGFCPTHTGKPRWWDLVVSPLLGADGKPGQLVSIGRDITERKNAEERLRQWNETLEHRVAERTRALQVADARQRATFDATRQLIGVLDLQGMVLDCNRAALDSVGATLAGIVGRPFSESPWFSGTPGMKQVIEEALEVAKAGGSARAELALTLPDGRVRIYDFAMHLVCDAAGEAVEIVPEATDITDQRRIEEQLRQSQKMEAVGQLTGGLAHDFNNLLTGITGSLELMQARVSQGRVAELDRYVNMAQGAAKRAAALTHRLLAFSRRQTLDPKPTNMNRLVAGMEELIRRTVGPAITVEVVGAAGLWTTMVDPNQLENALLNLCINARDAMPQGGRLTIETANKWMDERGAQERELAPGQYLSLCVSDTGTGMAPDVIARAFDPFFTTKPIGQGTGLGLSMTYGFVRQSGGQVRIYSELGQGTTMCLYLPRHLGAERAPDAPAELAGAPRARQGETVLVVDDEPTVRMLVSEVLVELGYGAIEVGDGPAGLEALRSDARIDLLITDVGLPGGMNGRQLAEAARALRPGLKVLFITGFAENAVLGSGHLEAGMQVMAKPFAMEALANRIQDLIEQG